MKNKFILIVIFFLGLISCEKEIDIDIPVEARQFVVEGSIEQDTPPIVILTKSEGYFDPTDLNSLQNRFIHGANVTVSNGTNSVQLSEVCTHQLPPAFLPSIAELIGVSLEDLTKFGFCLYTVDAIQNPQDTVIFGEIGKTYDLNIQVEGEVLTATTTIPVPIPADSYWYKDQPGYTDYGYLWFRVIDPPGLGDAYRIYTQRKGKDDRFIPANGSVFEDHFFDGLSFDAFIYRGHEITDYDGEGPDDTWDYFQQGDTIMIKYCTIDMPHFEFLQSFELAAFNNGNPFAAPATIKSNINGGLGIWGGYGVTYDTLIAVD